MTRFSVLFAVLIVLAVIGSFGVSLLSSKTSPVLWPTVDGNEGADTPSVSAGEIAGGYLQVNVTPETVQSVIATLKRPESYSRNVTVDFFWGQSGHGQLMISCYVSGNYSAARVTQNGRTQHSILGNDILYLWYDNEQDWYEGNANEMSGDLLQRLPTYETVLELPQTDITDAGFVSANGNDCILVETLDEALGYTKRYWIEIGTGLLLYAETQKDEKIVWRMSAENPEIPLLSDEPFLLPNGTDVRE